MGRSRSDLAQRFWAKVRKSDGCWEWTAARFPFGYGRFSVGVERKSAQAHRVAWELTHGAIPSSHLFVCHRCDNPPCVRPEHLFLGTIQDNTADMNRKGRRAPAALTPRPGALNGNAKLGPGDVDAIRRALADGVFQKRIAAAFGISQAHVSRIARSQSWRSK